MRHTLEVLIEAYLFRVLGDQTLSVRLIQYHLAIAITLNDPTSLRQRLASRSDKTGFATSSSLVMLAYVRIASR